MIIIFGLGNPGKKFKDTRHNLGQEVINLLQKKWGFSEWQKKAKLRAEISNGKFADKEILLVKSLTYMNESGRPIKKLGLKFQVPSRQSKFGAEQVGLKIYVIHDDLDLPLGKIKISKGRGSAGHKGVESIIKELRTKDFVRFRVGIARSAGNQKSKIKNQKHISKIQKLDKFVLERFSKNEKRIIEKSIQKTIQATEKALEEDIEKAMQEYNKPM